MGRRILIGVAAAIALQASCGSATANTPGFMTSVSCSPNGVRHSQPTHICEQGDKIRAVLRYSSTRVVYRLCIGHGRGANVCTLLQEANPGLSSVMTVSSRNYTGPVTVSWQVGTTEIASYPMRFIPDPVVPPFWVSTLIVSGTHRLFGLIVHHVSPGLRVRAWGACNDCQLPLHLVYRRGETRRYKVGGPPRLSRFSIGDQLDVLVDVPRPQPKEHELWGRLYRGAFVHKRGGGVNDTAVRQLDPSLCNAPGLPFGFSKDCEKVRSPLVPFYPF